VKLDFTGAKILVIGDPMIDEYHFGHVERISPEAPVPVFVNDHSTVRHGGAANVAQQLEALGASASTAWGRGTWTVKTRYMVGSHQLLRVDADQCVTNTVPALEGYSAIIISDYAKGACTPDVCQEAIQGALNLKIPVIVDPKGKDWIKYKGATCICPNHLEAQPWDGLTIEKRGAEGLRMHANGARTDYPSTARHVFDVTGAGDTVTAVIAACLAVGMSLEDACPIANAAAGYVVGEIGTTVCPIEELQKLCS
jgi:D-beta-D-heptose 7-phosphate kinase/D-beta-D-heptose 1-phosphate adenosyltransferase